MNNLILVVVILSIPSLVFAKYCKDFKTQKEAQIWYEKQKKSGGTGWKPLDRDNDGSACDCLPGGSGKKCPTVKKK